MTEQAGTGAAKELEPKEFNLNAGRQVLLVEDDLPLSKFLTQRLEAESLAVQVAHDGESALDWVSKSKYDLLILDLGLPKLDGISLLKQLRPKYPKLPVLVLTARSKVQEKVVSLDAGADDYLIKPFSPLELMARVRALLRRNSGVTPTSSQIADLTLDRQQWKVERNGRRIELTSREFGVLEFLMRNARQPVSRAAILEEVWNVPYDPSSNVVDVYVKYVRDKVDLEGEKKLIRTIRGVGYMLSDE